MLKRKFLEYVIATFHSILITFRTNQKECEKRIYPNLRARLDQPGPSWLGDFAENEILKTKGN